MAEKKDRVQARRSAILTAAEHVFAAKGYSAATVDEIAEKANLSKGSVYNYFQSKQELFGELFLQALIEDEANLEELIKQDIPARSKYDAFMKHCYARFTKYEPLGRLLLEFWVTAAGESGAGPFAQAFHALYERNHRRLVAMFRQGEIEGDFIMEHGPEVTASLLIAAIDGMHIQVLLGAHEPWTETEFHAFQKAVTRALQATGSLYPEDETITEDVVE
ncbi:MAG: TetR/AcrR family transcriptional regulator [Phycisphaerae bacterium]|nr:TetR/AcrR family transcriptional regulator [Phycisphaerae bacterium]